jgi:hypothetical protein
MRFLLKITFPVETANRAIKDGTFEKKLQRIMAGLRPEAVYFAAENGKRTGFLIVNMQETSQMPAIAEPFYLGFNADVEFHPVMIPEDLAKGNLASLGKKWA